MRGSPATWPKKRPTTKRGEFVNWIQANNGVGLAHFDHDAYPVNDATYPGFPVTRITTDNTIDPDRIAAGGAVAAHATNPNGATSIGDSVLMARNTINLVPGYDQQALRGHEIETGRTSSFSVVGGYYRL